MSIYSADSSGNPGSSLYVLDNPTTFTNYPLTNTFTEEDGANLERETDYFVVFEGTSGDYRVRLSESADEDAGGADGWSIHDQSHHKVGSDNWTPTALPARLEIRGIILPNTPAEGAAISGRVAVGQVLTADTSGITDANGLDNAAFSYQWVRVDGDDERDIPGATGSSYTLVEADYDKKIRVRVSFVDDAGYAESLTSPPRGRWSGGRSCCAWITAPRGSSCGTTGF